MKQTKHLATLTTPARFNELQRITAFVLESAAQVGFDAKQLGRIELAIDEACSNIIEHAYAGEVGAMGARINVVVESVAEQYLKVILTDTGKTFEPEAVPAYIPCTPQTDVNSLKVGGLGLHLMRQAMDDVCFEFNVPDKKGGVFNRLTMVKHL
jgi:anti-sigma regulatory factor (Ser/Thr protein kinase)